MNIDIISLLSCPGCGASELDLSVFAAPDADHVEEGFLRCGTCERLYFIIHGIPRLITEEFSDLVAIAWAQRRRSKFGDHAELLDTFADSITVAKTSSATQWNLEDVAFWEEEVYSDEKELQSYLQRAARSRANAGNRTFPREKHIFSHLRPRISGKTVVDLGCGFGQTVRVLLPPDELDYQYIGADLSISALRANRRTLKGDFIQCSVNALPFRRESVDVALCLGTLHHLHDPQIALGEILEAVKPNGYIGLHEVTFRKPTRSRAGRTGSESAHNEAIDPRAALAVLESACDLVDLKFEYSAVRGLAARGLSDTMRRSPRVTRAVLGVDDFVIKTAGRLVPPLASHAMLALGKKRVVSGAGHVG